MLHTDAARLWPPLNRGACTRKNWSKSGSRPHRAIAHAYVLCSQRYVESEAARVSAHVTAYEGQCMHEAEAEQRCVLGC